MSYRSIKRVLGETSLERKCWILFSICLFLLLGGSFFWVDQIAERLVVEKTHRQAREWVKMALLYCHWEHWDATTDPTQKKVRSELMHELITDNFESKILAIPGASTTLPNAPTVNATDPAEIELLRALEARWRKQLAEELEKKDPTGKVGQPNNTPFLPTPTKEEEAIAPVFETVSLSDKGRYHYYQPVYWWRGCFRCHDRLAGDALSAADGPPPLASQMPPFRAVKIDMSYESTQAGINSTRAVLGTVAILTVLFAMFALYFIVRYVIVKPLRHLRDVSDNISRGQLEMRADIHTSDEFEELADSFNRMVRHLIESQANLRKLNKELDAKVDELAQLNMRLYEMNRLKGDFLANMSHELRTPLNSIIGFSELLQGIESLSDKQKRYARNIQTAGRSLLEMINEILDLAKLEAGKMDVRLSEFQIDVLVNAQCDMVRSLSEEKNIDLLLQLQPDLPPMFQDQGKVQQVLTNLLSNAIKFTPEGGRITVTTRMVLDGKLELTVADTGIGIAAQDREVIFEKFRQGSVVIGKDGMTRQYSGTGLGLSIVRELCKLMGGEVTLESEVGKGSTFKVILPWSRSEPVRSKENDDATVVGEVTNRPSWTAPAMSEPAAS